MASPSADNDKQVSSSIDGENNASNDEIGPSVQGQISKADTLPSAVTPQVTVETNGANGNESVTTSQPTCPEASRQRSVPQPMKRRPDKDLNHDNWDEEDEPEEKGEFVKASEEKLKDRRILTAKRKQTSSSSTGNPFGAINFASGSGFGGFGGGSSIISAPTFDFSATQSKSTSAFNFSTPLSQPAPAFDFSTIQSHPTMTIIPTFNFRSITSSSAKPDKNASNGGQVDEVKPNEAEVTPQIGVGTNNTKGNESGSQPPAPEEAKRQRSVPQPMKRRPDKDLNHDNWDQEDEPEEKGEFIKASEDNLKNRKILTAKRKIQNPTPSANPFGTINFGSGLGSNGGEVEVGNFSTPAFDFSTVPSLATTTAPKFDFSNLWKNKDESRTDEDDVNGQDETTDVEATEFEDLDKHESSRDSAEDGSSASATTV